MKPFRDAISLHLIESSTRLRWKQKTKLGLPNVRKFQTKIKKPVWAAVIKPIDQNQDDDDRNPQVRLASTETTPLTRDELRATTTSKSMQSKPLRRPKQEKSIKLTDKLQQSMKQRVQATDANANANANANTNNTNNNAKRSGRILSATDSSSSDFANVKPTPMRDAETQGSNVDKMFSGMTEWGSKLGGEVTPEMEDKLPPFDWSFHNPDVVVEMDDDMKDYFSGVKTKAWEQAHGIKRKPKVVATDGDDDDEAAKYKSKHEFTGSKREREAKAFQAAQDQEQAGFDPKNSDAANDFNASLMDEKLSQLLNNVSGMDATDIPGSSASGARAMKDFMDGKTDSLGGDGSGKSGSQGQAQSPLDFEDLMNYEDLEKTMVEEPEEVWQARTTDNTLISWHQSLHSVEGGPALFIAHEFFDALPVHHFEYRPQVGWAETLVNVDEDEESPYHFRITRGNSATISGSILDKHFRKMGIEPNVGQQFSFSAMGNEICNDMARWCVKYGGAGFIVDYGALSLPPWTIQAVKDHKPCEMVSMPGEVDISAHVNFGQLKASFELNFANKMDVYGPVTQSYFLQGCGIIHRFRQYIEDKDGKNFNGDEKEKEKFIQTFGKIMDIDKLGGHFKVLGFAKHGTTTPVGFREPIAEAQKKVDERGIPVYK